MTEEYTCPDCHYGIFRITFRWGVFHAECQNCGSVHPLVEVSK